MKCEYCDKYFFDKSNIKRHQTTSKSCIKIQIEKNVKNIDIKKFICEHCDKNLSSKHSLKYHLNICKQKIKKDKAEKDDELKIVVKQLQEELKELKEKPNIINNNTVNNTVNNNLTINNIEFLSFMTESKIKEIFDKYYNIETMLGSNKSLAEFTIENFFTGEENPIYLSSDIQRNMFCFLKDNKKIFDANAKILIDLISTYGFASIQKLYNNHVKQFKQKPVQLNNAFNDIMKLKTECKDYVNQLSIMLPKTIEERKISDKNNNYIKTQTQENYSIFIEEDDNNQYIFVESEDEEDEDELIQEIISEIHISKYKLLEYKDYYKNKGKCIIPVSISKNNSKELKDKYINFLRN